MSADLESPSSPLAGALPEIRHRLVDNCSEIHFMSESESPIAGTIRFKRHVRSRYSHERKAWIPIDEPRWEWEPTILLVITATELVDKIVSGEHALREWVADVKLALRVTQNYQLIVMIKGLQKYYSKMKSQANKEYTTAARAGLGVGTTPRHHLHHQPTKDEIEGELVQLQVAEGCFLVHGEHDHSTVGTYDSGEDRGSRRLGLQLGRRCGNTTGNRNLLIWLMTSTNYSPSRIWPSVPPMQSRRVTLQATPSNSCFKRCMVSLRVQRLGSPRSFTVSRR